MESQLSSIPQGDSKTTRLGKIYGEAGDTLGSLENLRQRVNKALDRLRGELPEGPSMDKAAEVVPDGYADRIDQLQQKMAEELGCINQALAELEAYI